MRNYRHSGAIVTRTAPAGGVTSGVPVRIGKEFLVPQTTREAAASFSAVRLGCVALPAKSGDEFTSGAPAYFNETSGEVEKAASETNYPIGTVEGAASGGVVDVVLSGAPVVTQATKDVTIAAGASSGASAADPMWVGAYVVSCCAVSGNDKPLAGVAVAGDGAVTVTTAGNETAEATFRVHARLA